MRKKGFNKHLSCYIKSKTHTHIKYACSMHSGTNSSVMFMVNDILSNTNICLLRISKKMSVTQCVWCTNNSYEILTLFMSEEISFFFWHNNIVVEITTIVCKYFYLDNRKITLYFVLYISNIIFTQH